MMQIVTNLVLKTSLATRPYALELCLYHPGSKFEKYHNMPWVRQLTRYITAEINAQLQCKICNLQTEQWSYLRHKYLSDK